jgi:hypothetical protein
MMPLVGDIVLSFYLGASQTAPSNLHVVQAARGNDATMHSVTWRGYPFRFEIYYGLRLTYTPPHYPFTSVALDYTHAKIYAETDDRVAQTGTWNGAALDDNVPMSERVQSFEMTHGMNMLGISVLEQVAGNAGGGAYVGGGPVMFVPHTESRVDGAPLTSGYEYGGLGFQVLGGVRGCIGNRPVFSEIKYSRGTPVVSIAQGRADAVVRTVHELAGLGFGHCPR